MQLKDFYTCIQQLLHDYDCVIIPGFGGLVAQPQSAQVNTITRQIYPRSKKIAFNQNLLNNDGLLAEFISRKEKCTYAEAVLQIQALVKQLHQELADKNVVDLEHVGTLRFDGENKLIFSASRNESFLYDSYGLKPVKAVPLAVVNDKPRIMEKEEEVIPVTAIAEEEPVAETTEEKAIRRKRKLSIPFVAVSVLVIAFAGLTMYLASQNATLPFLHPDSSQTASFVDTSSDQSATTQVDESAEATPEEENTVTTTETEDPQPESSTKTNETPSADETAVAVPSSSASSSSAESGYYIIAGAFQVEGNAEKLLQELKSTGFADAQLAGRNSSNLLRVAYLKTSSMQEAESKLYELRNNSKEGWILHIH